ncbi:MAG: tetratricopeptide repeat protein [Acidobacteriota bacterium]
MKWAFAIVSTLALAAGGWLLMSSVTDEPEPWTSQSPEALDAFEAGLEDYARRYFSDAAVHFYRAMELDPAMVGPKIFLLTLYRPFDEEYQQILSGLQDQPLAELSERERFLVQFWRDRLGGEVDAARATLAAYLERFPDDPYALNLECDDRWDRGQWDEAEACYRRLIEWHPNEVDAQNRLGFLVMMQERFDQAEEYFRTYRYIAPDVAAPHDALGELYALVGRYEEADAALARALAVKADHCQAHMHRIELRNLQGRPEEASALVDRLAEVEGCRYLHDFGYFCAARGWLAYLAGDWQAVEALHADGACLDRRGFDMALHRVALHAGDLERAREIESGLAIYRQMVEENEFGAAASQVATIERHLEAVRLWTAGDPAACDAFASADEVARYWNLDLGALKLFNRRHWLRCLEATGDTEQATELRRQIEAVNPRFLAGYRVPELPSPLAD